MQSKEEKKVYWISPYECEIKKYPSYNPSSEEMAVVSVKAKEYEIIKSSDYVEGEIVVTTDIGYLKFLPKQSKAKEQQMEKLFNASKSFCTKLLSKVQNTLGGKTYDFNNIDDIKAFIDILIKAKMILGITGQEGKKGILKRVSPVTPLNPSKPKQVTNIIESQNIIGGLDNMFDVYDIFESLLEKLGLIQDEEIRYKKEEEIENIF